MSEIQFSCRSCRHKMLANNSVNDMWALCPACGSENTVPPMGKLYGVELFFSCGSCRQNLIVDVKAEGKEVECPHCQAMTIVPMLTDWESMRAKPNVRMRVEPILSSEEVEFLTAQRLP